MTVETLKPEEKVNLSISMSATCVRVCVDALRDQDATITEEELLERVRARIMFAKRWHHEV